MIKKLRMGVAKQLLDSSIQSVLSAVEIYNKPRCTFRVQTYITLMIIGWTKLLHAYFHRNNISYYYKMQNGRYETIDSEKKCWDLSKCIKSIDNVERAVLKNLEFFIKLRNKIEHRNISDDDIEQITIGETQALLYNYESFLVEHFGPEYSLNQSLRFSLQFSLTKDASQLKAEKRQLSTELHELKKFINTYRNALTEDEFNSQSYSIKFLIVPKISNNNRGDLAIDFIRETDLSAEEYCNPPSK